MTQGQLSLTKWFVKSQLHNKDSWATVHLNKRYFEDNRIICHYVNAWKIQCHFFSFPYVCIKSYPFGDEISAQHHVILRNSTIAWENWEEPAPRKEQTKSVIQQCFTLISATVLNCKISK